MVLRDPLPWSDLRLVAESAEELGYAGLFVPEIAAREAFSSLAALSGVTDRMFLGTGVITIGSRSPTTAAMGAASIHDLSSGRMVLGIGAGAVSRGRGEPGPLERVRRYVRILKQALSGAPVDQDELYGGGGFRLSLPLPDPPPIWLGALGDGMVRLAGEVADGVLLNWCTPERVDAAVRLVAEGADRAGRNPESVTVAVYVRACLGVSEDVALEALRPATGQYASFPNYRRQLDGMGLEEEAVRAAEAMRLGKPESVPSSLVRTLCVMGGRSDALARLEAFHQAGADLVLCYPVPTRDPYSSILGTVLAAAPSPKLGP